jgi:ParB family transcriptional regulator, chromosome partitioning protein
MVMLQEDVAQADKVAGFCDIPLEKITRGEQIRKNIDTQGEDFRSLVASVRLQGVLEPIIVTPEGEGYRLIAGERRFLAATEAGLATIPVRVITDCASLEETLIVQLTENLLRENLNPIDEAAAYLKYAGAKIDGMDLDRLLNLILLYQREPQRVEEASVAIIATIENISGKSTTSVRNYLSLLKLPEAIQTAVREGKIGLTQGYIFAANVDHPALMDLFARVLQEPTAKDELLRRFKKWRPGTAKPAPPPDPVKRYDTSLQSIRSGIEKERALFKKEDLEKLALNLRALLDFVEEEMNKDQKETPISSNLS